MGRAEARKGALALSLCQTKLPAVQALQSVIYSMLEGREGATGFAADALPASYADLSLQGPILSPVCVSAVYYCAVYEFG